MQTLLRIFGALGLLALAAFCVFGFMASNELSATARLPWQIAYGLLGVVSLIGAVFLLRRNRAGR